MHVKGAKQFLTNMKSKRKRWTVVCQTQCWNYAARHCVLILWNHTWNRTNTQPMGSIVSIWIVLTRVTKEHQGPNRMGWILLLCFAKCWLTKRKSMVITPPRWDQGDAAASGLIWMPPLHKSISARWIWICWKRNVLTTGCQKLQTRRPAHPHPCETLSGKTKQRVSDISAGWWCCSLLSSPATASK